MIGELVFYTNPMSRGRIARWMQEETGAACRRSGVSGFALDSAPATGNRHRTGRREST